MRISDLSKQTDLPVATIRFYLRERLLPPGTPTGRNQAEYTDTHVRRLQLIRAFTNIGQLELSSVRELLSAIEDEGLPIQDLYEIINRILFREKPIAAASDGVERAQADVDGFIDELGWHVDPNAAGGSTLAQVIVALQRLGSQYGVSFFRPYAEAAERLAILELDLLPAAVTGTDRAAAVVRNILFEVGIAAMRGMAQEHFLALRYHPGREPAP